MNYTSWNEAELQAYASLFQEDFNAEPWNESWSLEDSKERILSFMRTPLSDGLVLKKEDGTILGLIYGIYQRMDYGMTFEILDLCIRKEEQHHGYGKTLLSEFTSHLKKKGVVEITLLTLKEGTLKDFYHKEGYQDSSWMQLRKRIG